MSTDGAHAGSEGRIMDGYEIGLRDKLRKTANANRDLMIVESDVRLFTVVVAVMVVSVVIGGDGKVSISLSSKYAIFKMRDDE
ncbi:hypothetical protein TSUD_257600 [Trifolium subterraneum]|uniref:Transmembrane protein n=1 Tax=Trifolium subterraneum TaxID=3900 RepID=A0A2Z6M0B0_TRISU|nr:hypothetical protein TSUD_257600 [Trifolium subterraneum]